MSETFVVSGILIGLGLLVLAMLFFAWRSERSADLADEPGCRHDVTCGIHWTAEGWTDICLVCRQWIYYGDGDHPVK